MRELLKMKNNQYFLLIENLTSVHAIFHLQTVNETEINRKLFVKI